MTLARKGGGRAPAAVPERDGRRHRWQPLGVEQLVVLRRVSLLPACRRQSQTRRTLRVFRGLPRASRCRGDKRFSVSERGSPASRRAQWWPPSVKTGAEETPGKMAPQPETAAGHGRRLRTFLVLLLASLLHCGYAFDSADNGPAPGTSMFLPSFSTEFSFVGHTNAGANRFFFHLHPVSSFFLQRLRQ